MFRPGNLGHLGRLGLVAASQTSLVAQALAILAKYGAAANLYLPGVGAISGITAGNWLDNTGTTAATVDGQVGLVVSAGKAVGPELVTNGDFSAGSAGWSVPAGWSIASGVCTATSTSASFKQIATPCTAGKFYLVEFDWNHAGGILYVRVGVGAAATFTTSGRKSAVLLAAGIQGFEAYGGAVSGVLDNISVRELPGAHLTQSTAASRPVLRQSGGVYSWQFDGSNDSFSSTQTPGNAGFFCASANVIDSGVLRTLLGAGAGSDASSGVWLARAASNALTLQVGNGTTRNSVSAAYPVATNSVASSGWDSSSMFVGVNGTETSGAKTVDCTSSNTMNIGVLTGTTNPMLGTIGATIIMPTVLPTASERATLRQFIASLSGVTM